MRIAQLAAAAALVLSIVAPSAASAQDNSQQMIALARQLRAQAEQMKGSLSQEEIADMLAQADEIEASARDGAFSAPPPPAPSLSDRIASEHGGRLDWLDGEAACVGYGWENHRTFVSNYGDPERDRLCRAAFAHFERYFLTARDGGGSAASDPHLEAYDKAAQAAVRYYERK